MNQKVNSNFINVMNFEAHLAIIPILSTLLIVTH